MDTQTPSSSQQSNPVVTRVKALLMRAWRDRWNEVQWGIVLKKVLSTTTGDTRDLAEVLIGQAMVGTHPNSLIISYLKHSVFSQVIPATAAFKYITNYDDYNRPFCLLGLIDLAQQFAVNMNFCSGVDTGISLCKIIQNLIHWLLKTMLRAVQKFQETSQLDYLNVLDSAAVAVDKIADIGTVQSLLYIARSEEPEVYRDLEQTELNVRGTMSQASMETINGQVRQNVASALTSLSRVQDMVIPTEPVLDVSQLPICPAIVTMVALEAVLNPTNDIQPFVDQLCVLEKILKLQRPYMYCELLRACFLGLLDTQDTGGGGTGQEELMWSAFTFLKLPQILMKIQQQCPSHDPAGDLEAGVDAILNSSHMLDLTDIKLNCDSLIFLLNECKKLGLLSEGQCTKLQQRRSSESQKPRPSDQGNQPCASLIIRAEPTVTSILKTLDADCSKNQDALLGVLCHMLSGKSFDLILAAAAATAKLQSFSVKLIKFNEFAKQSTGEGMKASGTRALLFDISFLMLCHITQVYGTDMITSSPECIDTFFVQWALRCLPEDGKYKSVDISMPVDASKVDSLLNAFTSGSEITQGVPKWHDICTNAPYAIQEILFAWEHGALGSDSIKIMLNYVKSRMLCLPVVIAAWLCSYINMLGDEARVKPLAMLQLLTQPVDRDTGGTQTYTERSHLMTLILQKMIYDILPLSKRPPMPQYIPRNSLPADVMAKTMRTVFTKGWVDMASLHTLEQLVNLCGSDWFADRLVKAMLESSRLEDLNQHLSLVFALTHIDLDHITLSLLLHTVPALLLSSESQDLLTDPRGYTLAKLCVLAVTSSHTAKASQKDTSILYRRGRKRSCKEFDLEDLDDIDPRPQKRCKTMEPEITLDAEGFNFDIFLNSKEDGESSPTIDTKQPLNKALINLFRLMNAILHDDNVTPRTSFVVSFITEAVNMGQQHSRFILQFMPANMLSQVIPGVFDDQHVLQIGDLNTSSGRKIVAKAICQNSRTVKD